MSAGFIEKLIFMISKRNDRPGATGQLMKLLMISFRKFNFSELFLILLQT